MAAAFGIGSRSFLARRSASDAPAIHPCRHASVELLGQSEQSFIELVRALVRIPYAGGIVVSVLLTVFLSDPALRSLDEQARSRHAATLGKRIEAPQRQGGHRDVDALHPEIVRDLDGGDQERVVAADLVGRRGRWNVLVV